jgi:hypothetical protein
MKRQMRHRRPPRPHPAELDSNPAPPMPPGSVMLVCRQTGDVLSDVLEAENVKGWWPYEVPARRYAFSIIDGHCRGGHVHEVPTQDEVAARVAEAKQARTVIQHRVNVKR